jgi:hypothetical protein
MLFPSHCAMAQDKPPSVALQAEQVPIRIELNQFRGGDDLQVSLIPTRKQLLDIIFEHLSLYLHTVANNIELNTFAFPRGRDLCIIT